MSAAESVVSQIQHYQKSIQKDHGNSSRILHCINKLYSLPVTVQHLQDTGVGKTINSLRKSDGEVGESARALVYKWKQMVEDESENEHESNANVQAHSKYNGSSENDDHKVKIEKRSKEGTEKTSRSENYKDYGKFDHSKDYKRKRDSDHDQNKDKKYKSDKIDNLKNYNYHHDENKSRMNGNDKHYGLDEDWTGNMQGSGNSSDDDRESRHGYIKTERNSSEERHAQSSEDELHHEKSSKQEKSHKHKSKTSSGSSERSKHSSSRQEQKESKSSTSSKHREDKSSSSSGSSSHTKKDSSNLSENKSDDRSKGRDKEKKEKHKDKHRSKDEKKSSKDKKENEKKKSDDEDGVDSFSGKSFEAALGMMCPPEKSKKKSSSSTSSTHSPSKKKSKSSSSSSSSSSSERKAKDVNNFSYEMEQESPSQLPPSIDIDEDFGLPALNPNYKPLPQPNYFNSPPKRYQSEDDALSNIMYSKVQRTKVYSGNKTGYTHVPSLFDLCTRVLQENIDALEYTGGVPFDLLKPVLERATADQLSILEHYNAYLIEDTDIIWEYHCKKDFRNKKREEMETWREMYLRCREERESKLKSLTANIAASSKAKLLPVRKTQLAYVEGTAKPPRNIARKQAKFGTANASSSSAISKPDGSGLSSSFTGRSSTVSSGPAVSVPPPRGAGSSSSHSNSCKPKPKAPLMQKALQLIKYNRFKR